jgi:hypothetical protein
MEKNLGLGQGFKQLVKDQHMRNVTKKAYRISGDEPKASPKLINRNEKISHSIASNISDKLACNDVKNGLRKHNTDGTVKKDQRVPKFTVRAPVEFQEKMADLSKKHMLEAKTTQHINGQSLIGKYGSGEGYQKQKVNHEKMTKSRSNLNNDVHKYKSVNDADGQMELLLQKNYLKSIIMNSDAEDDLDSDIDSKELMEDNYTATINPKTIFTNSSCHGLRELKSKPQKIKNEQFSQRPSSTNFNSKGLTSEDKNDDSDESGMSYLMKKYLQASDEAARKVSEFEHSSLFMKNSSTQANIGEHSKRKPTKMKKIVTTAPRPRSGNVGSNANIFSKLKTLKKM